MWDNVNSGFPFMWVGSHKIFFKKLRIHCLSGFEFECYLNKHTVTTKHNSVCGNTKFGTSIVGFILDVHLLFVTSLVLVIQLIHKKQGVAKIVETDKLTHVCFSESCLQERELMAVPDLEPVFNYPKQLKALKQESFRAQLLFQLRAGQFKVTAVYC